MINFGLSLDGGPLVTASSAGIVREWDTNTGKQIRVMADLGVGIVRAKSNEARRWLALAGTDGIVYGFDYSLGRLLKGFLHHTASIASIQFCQDQPRLLTADSAGTVIQWKIE